MCSVVSIPTNFAICIKSDADQGDSLGLKKSSAVAPSLPVA